MAETRKASKSPGKKLRKVTYSDDLKIYYANNVNITVTIFDVTIDFGQRQTHIDLENPPIINDLRIMMSLEHAKVFSQKLTDLLASYEENVGQIVTEPKKK